MREILEQKKKEHSDEIELATKELENLKENEIKLDKLQKLLTLKDKVLFHKAAYLTLHEILEIYEKEQK